MDPVAGAVTWADPSDPIVIVARSGGVEAVRFCKVSLAGAITASVLILYVYVPGV